MTKLLTSLLITMCALSAFASTDPTKLCDGNACSEPMLNIIQGYSQGIGTFADQNLTGYSGKCFHLSSMYDPAQAHYGAFVFESNATALHISGMFGFFYSEDPYSGMSPEQMKASFISSGSKGSDGIIEGDHVELAYVSDSSELRYWYRTDATKQTLYVIGRNASNQGSVYSAVFCSMIRH